MTKASLTTAVAADQLVLAGHLLAAVEQGRMPVHPVDYLNITSWAAAELGRLDTPVLRCFRNALPPPLQVIAENVLHERREATWCADGAGHHRAQAEVAELLRRFSDRPNDLPAGS